MEVVEPTKLRSALETALQKLIEAEAEVTKYDSVVGDGDCGIGLKRGAEGVLSVLPSISSDDAMLAFAKICPTVETTVALPSDQVLCNQFSSIVLSSSFPYQLLNFVSILQGMHRFDRR